MIKAFTTFLSPGTQGFDDYDDDNSIALQAVDIDDLEGWEFSKKFRDKSRGDMKKLMDCVGH